MNSLNCFTNSFLNVHVLPKGLLTLSLTLLFSTPLTSRAADDLTIYDDEIANGWNNLPWNATVSSSITLKKLGNNSLAVNYNKAWAGLSLHANATISSKDYKEIRFWVYGDNASGLLWVNTQNDQDKHSANFEFKPTPNTWKEIIIPLSKLGNTTSISRVNIMDATGTVQPVYYIDDLRLVGNKVPLALTVNAAANRKPISKYIYGMNYYSEAPRRPTMWTRINLPVMRWGGNDTSRYNWELNVTNTGSDSFFVNTNRGQRDGILNPPKVTAVTNMIDNNKSLGIDTLLTVPMIGYVAKDQISCGFSIKKYPVQNATDPDRPNCGDGIIKKVNNKPVYIKGNKSEDTSIEINENDVKKWVTSLIENYNTAKNGRVKFYNLDNEPDGWHVTHRDVFPVAITYNELRDRTYRYASAIKSADPDAQILGPVLTNWASYWKSPNDLQRGFSVTADRDAHGKTPLVAWYLQQMKTKDTGKGKRLLDYFDLHYYPQCGDGKNCSLIPKRPETPKNIKAFKESKAIKALRLRSTRSLWDPSYADESWVRDVEPQEGGVIKLIPRMKAWVKDNYPGTKIAISEYMWGALWDMNGALAQADILGIFGREGLDLATLWQPPQEGEPGDFAFRMYRNYDGQGHTFGETSVFSASTDQDKLAIYTAQEKTSNALNLMVINKTGGALSAPITLKNFKPSGVIETWHYSEANTKAILHPNNLKFTGTQFSSKFPANSITLLRLPKG